jgi:hypothetical protein
MTDVTGAFYDARMRWLLLLVVVVVVSAVIVLLYRRAPLVLGAEARVDA